MSSATRFPIGRSPTRAAHRACENVHSTTGKTPKTDAMATRMTARATTTTEMASFGASVVCALKSPLSHALRRAEYSHGAHWTPGQINAQEDDRRAD
jgi:hypothetical protein